MSDTMTAIMAFIIMGLISTTTYHAAKGRRDLVLSIFLWSFTGIILVSLGFFILNGLFDPTTKTNISGYMFNPATKAVISQQSATELGQFTVATGLGLWVMSLLLGLFPKIFRLSQEDLKLIQQNRADKSHRLH